MDFLAILQLALQYGPMIKSIIDEASTNDDIITKVRTIVSPVLITALETQGAAAFPKAAPAIHILGGVIASFDPNVTKWLQKELNTILALTTPLVVDGIYGPKTTAAVEQLQVKLGLKVDGIAGMLTQAAIQAIVTKLG